MYMYMSYIHICPGRWVSRPRVAGTITHITRLPQPKHHHRYDHTHHLPS